MGTMPEKLEDNGTASIEDNGECINCGALNSPKCSGCKSYICEQCMFGQPGTNAHHDAKAQGRCVECAGLTDD